jgi:hypothetical protein
MAAILFSSIGIPMLAAGQDFLRSKHGVNNTYLRGDLNALDYRRLTVSRHARVFRRLGRLPPQRDGPAAAAVVAADRGLLPVFYRAGARLRGRALQRRPFPGPRGCSSR